MENFEIRTTNSSEARQYAELRAELFREQLLDAGVPERYVEAHIRKLGNLDDRTEHIAKRLKEWLSGEHVLRSVYSRDTGRLSGFFVGDLDSRAALGDKVPVGKYVGTINLAPKLAAKVSERF